MNGREIIKDIMTKSNITNSALANKLGITQAALWDRIDTTPRKGKPRKDIPVSLLSEMVQAMDYKVTIVPSSTSVAENGYVIESYKGGSNMKPNEIVKDIMKFRGVTYAFLADKLGKSTPSAISNPLSRENGMRIDTFLEMIEAMDCEVIVKSKLNDNAEWNVYSSIKR